MNDLVVYGNTCGARETIESEEVGFGSLLDNIVIGNLVDLRSGDSGFDCLPGNLKCFG